MEQTFVIKGKTIELLKLLKATGLADTGGMAKAMIEDGLVKVDGKTEYRKRCKLRENQTVELEGNIVQIKTMANETD